MNTSIPSHLTCESRASCNCDAFPLQFLSFPLLYSDKNDNVIVRMTEITWTRACFSPRPLNIAHDAFSMHLSVLLWPFLIIRFLRLLVICIRARGCNWDALHSRLAMISPVKICRCYYPEYYKPVTNLHCPSLIYIKTNDKCKFRVTKKCENLL